MACQKWAVMAMSENLLYSERLTSNKTEALFLGLTSLFFLLFVWRMTAGSLNALGVLFLCLSAIFLFYVVNFRVLRIRLSPEALKLTFGIFSWTVALDNVADCRLDHLPLFMKYGGAGIHFMTIRKRYRASFNFLEYPRLVIALKRKAGPVRDISFSTRRPDDLQRLLAQAVAARQTT